ncbi:MAG: cobalt-precorrin-3B C(17)-methyltransferase, partial [Bacillota bacterium]
VISLSDLLTPWELIERRLEAAAAADFVLVLYNPASHRRREQINVARQIMLRHKEPTTPVGLVRNAYREEESCVITDLQNMLEHPVDMLTIVFIGNSSTRVLGKYMVTPRGYQV